MSADRKLILKKNKFFEILDIFFRFFLCSSIFALVETGVNVLISIEPYPSFVFTNLFQTLTKFEFVYFDIFFRYIGLHFIFALVLTIFYFGLRFKSSKFTFVLFALLGLSRSFYYFPQIYVSEVPRWVLIFTGGVYAILIFLIPFFNLRSVWFTPQRFSYLGFVVLFFIGIGATQPGLGWFESLMLADYQTADNSVTVISIDSLRQDILQEYIKAHPDSEIALLIKDSVAFSNVITPLARTQPSLTTLFSGKSPVDHGVRENLIPGVSNTDVIYKDSLFSDFKSKGFQTGVFMDETKFAIFKSGNVIDTVVSPQLSFTNLTTPFVLRSSFFWSYFNNSLGYWMFPEIRANGAYTFGYAPKEFLKAVLNQSKVASNRPSFNFIHTCALHYPSHSRMPWLGQYQNASGLVTEYKSFFSPPRAAGMHSHFRDLYKGQFSLTANEFLNPLIEKIRRTNSNQTIILMSDHGETFPNEQGRLMGVTMPIHGGPLMFDEDSNSMVFYIFTKGPKGSLGGIVDSPLSLSDMRKVIYNFVFSESHDLPQVPLDRLRYAEAGSWFVTNLRSILQVIYQTTNVVYKVNADRSYEIKSEIAKDQTIAKARSVVYPDNSVLTLTPTAFGIETVYCKDTICESAGQQIQLKLKNAVDFLLPYLKSDYLNGEWPFEKLRLTGTQVAFSTDGARVPESSVAKFYWAKERLNQNYDIFGALKMLFKLHIDPKMPASYKQNICLNVVTLCSTFGADLQCKEILMQFTRSRNSLTDFCGRGADNFKFPLADHQIQTQILNLLIQADQQKNFELLNSTFHLIERLPSVQRRTYFMMKYWQENDRKLSAESFKLSKILDFKKKFAADIDTGFYETQIDWLRFLGFASHYSNIDFMTEAIQKFWKQKKVPFEYILQEGLPAFIWGFDRGCFRERVAPMLIEGAKFKLDFFSDLNQVRQLYKAHCNSK